MAVRYRSYVLWGVIMKVKVDITLIHVENRQYVKQVYEDCFWDCDQSANIIKTGLTNIDSLYVSIPLAKAQNLKISNCKDFVIQGEIIESIDNTSEETQSASLKAIRNKYECFTVNSYSKKDHGSPRMHHWELSCK